MTYKQWCLDNIGYETQTTFFEDFSIAEHFGTNAIKDTYNRAFNEWKSNIKYLTELVMVLNHKIWFNYEKNEPLAKIYDTLWKQADQWCCENLKGEDAEYYYRTLD